MIGWEMDALSQITYILNLIALTVAIWLGFYIISRSPRRLISWLTGLTLWSISGIFLNMLLSITPPPVPVTIPAWQKLIFPFWSTEVFNSGEGVWLSGWLATPAIAFWHHITILLREKKPSRWHSVQIVAVYLIAATAVYAQLNSTLMFSEATGDPLHLNYLKPGIYYSVFMSLLTVLAGISAYNLIKATRSTPSNLIRKQMITLTIATCTAGITGPISLVVLFDPVSIPRVINTLLLFITIVLIGFSIARYSALIEGRLIRRDLIYNASLTVVILLVYLLITWISIHLFHIPNSAYIFVTVLAIITHSLVDFARGYLEKIFFRKEERQLRSELHQLTNPVIHQQFENPIEAMLSSISATIRATYAIIFMFDGEQLVRTASYNWGNDKHNLSHSQLATDDLIQLQPDHFPSPFTDAALLVPLYRELEQIGAIIIGHPVNSIEYPQEDQELLLESCDIIAETIANLQAQEEIVFQAKEEIQAIQTEPPPSSARITAKMTEDLLRNVLDYAYLGSSDFSQLPIVQKRFPDGSVTHIDCGKIVFQVLEEVVEKLRPQDELNRDPPPREWHPYLILHRAYFEDKLNREIMAELYISEGTFNRTRRAALRSVARALEEIQQALN
jgi:hypothetical protein